MTFAHRAAAALFAVLATLAGGGANAQSSDIAYDRPDRLVRISGGRQLNLVCRGSGSPQWSWKLDGHLGA